MSGNEWKLPLNIAIGFHLLVALAIVFLPQLLMPTPRMEELYTVNLVSISDMAPAQAPAPAKAEPAAKPEPPSQPPPKQAEPVQPPPPKPIAPETPKKIVEKTIALQEPEIVEPAPVTPPAPAEAISIKPLKRKVKAEVPPEPPPVPKKTEQDLSKLQRQKLAEILRAEQKATEEARVLAEEAELEKRLAEATLNRMKAASARQAVAQAEQQQSSGQVGNPDRPNALESQYYSSVAARIQPFWSLPEYRQWDPNLLAIVVITVQKDGRITAHYFEQSSGDAEFDKYVTKTLQDVGTLPPIPAAIRKDRLEFGLRFSPGGVR